MNVIIALYSGILQMLFYPNSSYLKDKLKLSAGSYTSFMSLIQTPWVLKPLYGFISDTFYPFKSKIKFYIVVMCTVHILISLLFFFNPPDNSNMFGLFVGLIYFCTGFIDALGEGMTSTVTKMEIRLCDLKSEEEQ